MNKKAQSSLEYITTYGWALILFIAVAAVIFFVLSPDTGEVRFRSDSTKFLVRGSDSDEGGFKVDIINATGRPITIDSITSPDFGVSSPQTGTTIPSGGTITITGTFPSGNIGGGSFTICYTGQEPGCVEITTGPNPTPKECPNSICAEGENCPADASACPEPSVCLAATCTNGCGTTPIAEGEEDREGDNQCHDNLGCDTAPCACNGMGACDSPASVCGNGVCEAGEDSSNCNEDCPIMLSSCGDPPGGWQPYTNYALGKDLTMEVGREEPCFEINQDGVTLNGMRRHISGPYTGTQPAAIIKLAKPSGKINDFLIQNCRIFGGQYGIFVDNPGDNIQVIGIHIEGCEKSGIYIDGGSNHRIGGNSVYFGNIPILVSGTNIRISSNVACATPGHTDISFSGSASPDSGNNRCRRCIGGSPVCEEGETCTYTCTYP
ncbi:MAG: right-handed parallel beta-helix repeat-containing protein [Candidatus Diapherotrites archaeon]|nr:right-handed parallel beta-helix repeat-containing protein [Candidatus Diapherotrites archaeon]